jgi:long-chain fatty acid transport protein
MRTIITLLLVAFSAGLMAEGYQVNLQGQKNTGMGHTGTGFVLGPSTIHFNPGGLALFDKKMSFTAGTSLIFGNNIFTGAGTNYEAQTENPIGTPFYFYGSYKVNDDLAVGLGVNTPYGNSLKWEDDWAGRYLINSISLRSIQIQPTVSYKINDWLSAGVGMLIGLNSVELNKSLPIEMTTGESEITLEGSTTTFGVNAGLMFTPTEELSIGISYRSQMKAKVSDGTAELDVPEALIADGTFPAETGFSATLPLPNNYNFGVSYKVTEKLMVAVDIHYVQWDVYDSLIFDFEDNTPAFQDSHNPREYSNSFIYRIGAQYDLLDEITLRAGAYYDATPTNDEYYTPETPGANKIGISGGASIRPFENFEIDLSMLYIHGLKREAEYVPDKFKGTYYTNAFIPGIGLTYSF